MTSLSCPNLFISYLVDIVSKRRVKLRLAIRLAIRFPIRLVIWSGVNLSFNGRLIQIVYTSINIFQINLTDYLS